MRMTLWPSLLVALALILACGTPTATPTALPLTETQEQSPSTPAEQSVTGTPERPAATPTRPPLTDPPKPTAATTAEQPATEIPDLPVATPPGPPATVAPERPAEHPRNNRRPIRPRTIRGLFLPCCRPAPRSLFLLTSKLQWSGLPSESRLSFNSATSLTWMRYRLPKSCFAPSALALWLLGIFTLGPNGLAS